MNGEKGERPFRTLALQAVLTLAISAPFSLLGFHHALSALLGGALAIIGNIIVVMLVFGRYRASESSTLATRMMSSAFLRLLVVGAGFGLIFNYYSEPVIWALFGSFLLVHLLPAWWVHRVTSLKG